MRQVVILAGGLGTRMAPATTLLPKSLLEVAGRPFLAWQLERLARSGFDEALLCIGHLGEAIRAFAGDGAAFGLRVRYADEGARHLGTLGALVAARPLLEARFVVTYGDSFLDLDAAALLGALASDPAALGVMTAWRNEGALEPSNVALEGARVRRYDKRRAPGEPALDHIDYGATALDRRALDGLPEGTPLGLDELFARLASEGHLHALRVPSRFFEIGSPEGLAALDAHLRADLGGARRASPVRRPR